MIDYSPVFHHYQQQRPKWRRWVKRHYIDEFGLQPGTLLDAGCGNGFWGSLFADYGFAVTGLDLNPVHIRDGRRRYRNISLRVGDLRHELPVGVFDVVFCRALPEFYAERLGSAGLIVKRLLGHVADGGALLLGFHSRGDGSAEPGSVGVMLHHHPHDRLSGIAGRHLDRAVSVGNSLQLLARP